MTKFHVGQRVTRTMSPNHAPGSAHEAGLHGTIAAVSEISNKGSTFYSVQIDGRDTSVMWLERFIAPKALAVDQFAIILREAGLTSDEARRAVRNWNTGWGLVDDYVTKGGRPGDLLMAAFLWSSSPEGFDYWSRIYKRLIYREVASA